jgi:hypothetical protein
MRGHLASSLLILCLLLMSAWRAALQRRHDVLPAHDQLEAHTGNDVSGWAPLDVQEALADGGFDAQILRDLAPWAREGFSMEELEATRSSTQQTSGSNSTRKAPILDAWVVDGLVYLSAAQAQRIPRELSTAMLAKVQAIYHQLEGVLAEAVWGNATGERVPDVLFLLHLNPTPLLSGKPPAAPQLNSGTGDTHPPRARPQPAL